MTLIILYGSAQSPSHKTTSLCLQTFSGFLLLSAVAGYGHHGSFWCGPSFLLQPHLLLPPTPPTHTWPLPFCFLSKPATGSFYMLLPVWNKHPSFPSQLSKDSLPLGWAASSYKPAVAVWERPFHRQPFPGIRARVQCSWFSTSIPHVQYLLYHSTYYTLF